MRADFIRALQAHFETDVINLTSVTGGDINQVFALTVKGGDYFVKTNYSEKASSLFSTEYNALKAFEQLAKIPIPKLSPPILFRSGSFLAMEYIPSAPYTKAGWISLANNLAKLHLVSNSQFGWQENNFIGTLVQDNNWCKTWKAFFINKRLEPQIDLAYQKGYFNEKDLSIIERFKEAILPLLESATPSLLHGDLWSGNFLISEDGVGILIDPAVYFGHKEVDMAMSKLFGGFDEIFYEHYYSICPPQYGHKERVACYQLYYLLVHLNLFGLGYKKRCWEIISYFAQK